MEREEYQRLFTTDDKLWWFRGRWGILEYALRSYRKSTGASPVILDAGCGTGANLLQLAGIGRGVGIDLSADALNLTARRHPERLVRGSVLVLPFQDDAFDVVISNDVLYHQWVTDDIAALRELARVLKPGGMLLVHVAAMEIFRGSHDVVNLTRHRYTVCEMRDKLSAGGLQVQRVCYRNFLLSPVLLARRFLHRAGGNSDSDLSVPVAWLNNTLTGILKLENVLLRYTNLPFGSSVFAIAHKPKN
ncbi:MAG: class I SAM-dependent methyltransferase [Candidatus Sumerlaeaceae bacterium]